MKFTSHSLHQWLGFAFITAVTTIFLIIFLIILGKLLQEFLRRGADESCEPLLPDTSPAIPTNLHFKLRLAVRLALTLTCLLAVSFVLTYLVAAAIGINAAFSSWRLDYSSPFQTSRFMLYLTLSAIVAHKRVFTDYRGILMVSCFQIFIVIWPSMSYTLNIVRGAPLLPNNILNIVRGAPLLPNDILMLAIQIISVVSCFIVSFQPSTKVTGTDDKQCALSSEEDPCQH